MFKDKKILIIGAGQIGEACAIRFSKDHPKEIILHTLTKEESFQAIKNVSDKIYCEKTILKPSWGNLLVPNDLIYTNRKDLFSDDKKLESLINYYYSNVSPNLLKDSALYQVAKKWKPNIIIDTINTATVVGYLDDPYSLQRSLIKSIKDDKLNWKNNCIKLLTSAIIPSLIRFTQVLKQVLSDLEIESYIKVSTTGLGGMGMNLMYTHGDVNEPGMSSGILGKVSAAGVFHQLMWSLRHTPGVNIRIVVPAALVGWQAVQFGKFRSHGKYLSVVDNINIKKIEFGKKLQSDLDTKISTNSLEIPFVDSGENCAYSLYEMHAITNLGQMESITREEVAQAVYESSKGSTKNDLLTAMDYAALGPTYGGAFQRRIVLDSLKKIQDNKKIPSIATNSLGPTVSKHLFELYIFFALATEDIYKLLTLNPIDVSKNAQKYILKDKIIRSQILSLGLPIIFDNDEYLRGNSIFIPDKDSDMHISSKNLEKWVDAGWVDLRSRRIAYWQKWIKKAKDLLEKSREKGEVCLEANYNAIESKNIGEILGLIYSIQGGERRKEY